jgi:predicted DNA-binding protein
LGKSRTVRLPATIDGRLQARAAKTGKSVSELIRQTVEAEYSQDLDTAGDWVLKLAKEPPPRAATRPDRKAFQEAYRKRHA